MIGKLLLAAGMVAVMVPARAAEAPQPTLPSLASNPPPSPWSGLVRGTEVFGEVARKGAKGMVGGGAYVGYDREFDNNLMVGIQASTGLVHGLVSSPG